ncbi:MAG: UvrD-helicase domain-containing protein, partial [Planctomycetes bacterium]|nr:UvrD-helicase domain-containing protein [Planctomycetota bacterium]
MTAARYPKPAILEEIPRDRHAVIEASAGTGKTYALEHLLVELLLTEPVSIEQILVVTFTDRATHELRMRVRALLARLRAPDRNEAAPGEPAWTLDEAAREKLDAALRQFDLAPIATIHAFCRGVLTENAFNGGRLFEQELVDGRRLFAEVLRRTIRTVLACREPFRTLLRWWAACHGMDALTAGLYQAVRADVRILDADGAERYIAAVEAAAAVLCGAVGVDRLRGGLGEVTSKGKRLGKNSRDALERHLAALGEVVRRAAEPVDLFRDRRSLARPLEYLAEKRRAFDFGGLAPDLDAILSGIATLDRLKAVALAAFRDEAARAFARDKERRGLYDFGDMLALVHEALRGENGPALAAALRRRYRFALIDEFQDTDRVQWDIFRRIFFEDGGRHRLYTVGDPKQAIYAFRGADVRAYLRAREAIVGAGGARLALTRNYRSTAAMIAAVNALLLRDGQDAFFTGRHIGYDRPVECGRPALRAVAADGAAVRPLCLLRVEPGAGRGAERLGRAVAAAIRDLVDRRALCVGEREDALAAVGYGDIFVMTRTNRECDRMGEFLRAAGVPFAFYRKEGLFQTDEARDIRDLLRAIAEPADRSRLGRAWVTPFFGVPLGEVARFQELEPDHPFARRLLAWRDAARRRDFETLFVRILDESGVLR